MVWDNLLYDTTGGGSYDLEDLDGNIIVKGSVGSVGPRRK